MYTLSASSRGATSLPSWQSRARSRADGQDAVVQHGCRRHRSLRCVSSILDVRAERTAEFACAEQVLGEVIDNVRGPSCLLQQASEFRFVDSFQRDVVALLCARASTVMASEQRKHTFSKLLEDLTETEPLADSLQRRVWRMLFDSRSYKDAEIALRGDEVSSLRTRNVQAYPRIDQRQ